MNVRRSITEPDTGYGSLFSFLRRAAEKSTLGQAPRVDRTERLLSVSSAVWLLVAERAC